jgi:hypothetical protein
MERVMRGYRIYVSENDQFVVECDVCNHEMTFNDGESLEVIGNTIIAHESGADGEGCTEEATIRG